MTLSTHLKSAPFMYLPHLWLLLAVCTSDPATELYPENGWFSDCPSPASPGSVCTATCATWYVGAPNVTCQPDGTYGALTGACNQDCKWPRLGCIVQVQNVTSGGMLQSWSWSWFLQQMLSWACLIDRARMRLLLTKLSCHGGSCIRLHAEQPQHAACVTELH
jgi:hypothetical protein